jgi:hypothetical protein
MSEFYFEGLPVLGPGASSVSTVNSELPRVIRRVIELHDDDGDDFDELSRILGL